MTARSQPGALTVVGLGMRLGVQCTPEARRCIAKSDVVFAVAGDKITQRWLERLNPRVISLHGLYGAGRGRDETYEAMTETILTAVRAGENVCAAFYGHPGVFVLPSHDAVTRARAEGFEAVMLPGVSAEDCLYADLGIDPGQLGCQSYEATDFIVNARRIDPTAALILWQIALAGDQTWMALEPDPRRLAVLVEVLREDYPADHGVIVYEAATLPTTRARIDHLVLSALPAARVSQQSTLYLPPRAPPEPSPERLALLRLRLG